MVLKYIAEQLNKKIPIKYTIAVAAVIPIAGYVGVQIGRMGLAVMGASSADEAISAGTDLGIAYDLALNSTPSSTTDLTTTLDDTKAILNVDDPDNVLKADNYPGSTEGDTNSVVFGCADEACNSGTFQVMAQMPNSHIGLPISSDIQYPIGTGDGKYVSFQLIKNEGMEYLFNVYDSFTDTTSVASVNMTDDALVDLGNRSLKIHLNNVIGGVPNVDVVVRIN